MEGKLKQYLEYVHHRVRESTWERIGWQLKQVQREITRAGGWGKMDTLRWLRYFDRKRKRGLSDGYLRQIQWEVKGFYKYLKQQGKVTENPISWEIIRKEWFPRHVPSQAVMEEILDGDFDTHYPFRDSAICELVYACGLRASEVVGLNLGDVGPDSVRVVGKGNRERRAPMGRKAWQRIEHYLCGEREKLVLRENPLEETLFLNRSGRPMRYQSIRAMVKKRVRSHPVTLHGFRHACATHMLERGANVFVLQKLLGHRKLSSTEVYTRVRPSGLREMEK